MKHLDALGIASCVAARDAGCSLGPLVVRDSREVRAILGAAGLALEWKALVPTPEEASAVAVVSAICDRLGRQIMEQVAGGRPFVCFGGDHSSAMGIWGGAMQALEPASRLGLVWIDAHMDAHTFSTSPSGNLHGMPLAALLGQGDARLRKIYGNRPVLPPENLVLLGVRSFEAEEQRLLERLRVPIHYMGPALEGERLADTLQEIFSELGARCSHVGISIDVDAIDPRDAPGTGIPEPDGLSGDALCRALSRLRGDRRLVGLEIAEFKPASDVDGRTERLIAHLVSALYGDPSRP
jgi:arginase